MLEKLKELLGQINTQAIKIYLAVIIGGSALLGFVVQLVITNVEGMKDKIRREISGPPYNMGKPFLLSKERL